MIAQYAFNLYFPDGQWDCIVSHIHTQYFCLVLFQNAFSNLSSTLQMYCSFVKVLCLTGLPFLPNGFSSIWNLLSLDFCWWFHLLGSFLLSYNTIFPLLLELLGSYSKGCCPDCHVAFFGCFLVLSFNWVKIWVQGHWKKNQFCEGQCAESGIHCWHCICSRSSKKSIKATRTLWNVCLILQILRLVPRFSNDLRGNS